VTARRAALVWFRRDLRDFDHAALHAALHDATRVHALFVFDRAILDALDDPRIGASSSSSRACASSTTACARAAAR
jgi:deoxyribodipyrimidine photo-lyase